MQSVCVFAQPKQKGHCHLLHSLSAVPSGLSGQTQVLHFTWTKKGLSILRLLLLVGPYIMSLFACS